MKKEVLITILVICLIFITSCEYHPTITGKQIEITEITTYELDTTNLILNWNFDQQNLISIGQIIGSPTWSTDTPSNQGYSLNIKDGSLIYLTGEIIPENNDYTVMAWYKTDDFNNNYLLYWDAGYGWDTDSNIKLDNNLKIKSVLLKAPTASDHPIVSLSTPTSSEWNHVAIVVQTNDNGQQEIKLYLNGNYIESKFSNEDSNGIKKIGLFSIGKYSSSQSSYNGFIDDVYLFKRVLNNNEIKNYYNDVITSEGFSYITEDTPTVITTETYNNTTNETIITTTEQQPTTEEPQTETPLQQPTDSQEITTQEQSDKTTPKQDKKAQYIEHLIDLPKIDFGEPFKENIQAISNTIQKIVTQIASNFNIEFPSKIKYQNEIFSQDFIQDNYNIINNENINIPNLNLKITDYLIIDNTKISLYKEDIAKLSIRKQTKLKNNGGKIIYGYKNQDTKYKNIQFLWEIEIPEKFTKINNHNLNQEFSEFSSNYILHGDKIYSLSFKDVQNNFGTVYSSYNPTTRILSVYSNQKLIQSDEEIILDPEWTEVIDATNLVLLWNFDDGSTATDQSGNGYNGVIANPLDPPQWSTLGQSPSSEGYSITLDGIDDFIDIEGSTLIPASTDYTIMVWYKTSDYTDNPLIAWDVSNWNMYQHLGLGTRYHPNEIVAYVYLSPSPYYPQLSLFVPQNPTEWTHVALVYENDPVKTTTIYVNGQLEDTISNSDPAFSSYLMGTFGIGIHHDDNQEPYTGSIDEVFLFNRVLEDNEISSYYNTWLNIPPSCGDGSINVVGEECDDSDTDDGDGCSSICLLEEGWNCDIQQQPTACEGTEICGDSLVVGVEECDSGLYCTSCQCDSGYQSTIPVSQNCEIFTGDIFYVDDENCDNNWLGTINQPWCTINYAVNNENVDAGDTIYVREGTYRESIYLGRDGESDNYIILQKYLFDDGNAIIDGSIELSGFSQGNGDMYSKSYSSDPTGLFLDDVLIEKVWPFPEVNTLEGFDTLDDYLEYNQWTYDGVNDLLYIKLSDNPSNHNIEITSKTVGISINKKKFWIIDGFDIRRYGGDGKGIYSPSTGEFVSCDQDHLIIRNNIIEDNQYAGILLYWCPSVIIENNIIENNGIRLHQSYLMHHGVTSSDQWELYSGNIYKSLRVYEAGPELLYVDGELWQYNYTEKNSEARNVDPVYLPEHQWCYGLGGESDPYIYVNFPDGNPESHVVKKAVFGGGVEGGHGIEINTLTTSYGRFTIMNNQILSNGGKGIAYCHSETSSCYGSVSGSVIYNNTVYNSYESGVDGRLTENVTLSYNNVFHNGILDLEGNGLNGHGDKGMLGINSGRLHHNIIQSSGIHELGAGHYNARIFHNNFIKDTHPLDQTIGCQNYGGTDVFVKPFNYDDLSLKNNIFVVNTNANYVEECGNSADIIHLDTQAGATPSNNVDWNGNNYYTVEEDKKHTIGGSSGNLCFDSSQYSPSGCSNNIIDLWPSEHRTLNELGQLEIDSYAVPPEFVDQDNNDLRLQSTSPMIDVGVPLTYTTQSTTSQTVYVLDSYYFHDIGDYPNLPVNEIVTINDQQCTIIDVDYEANWIKCQETITYNNEDKIYWDYIGNKPDIGAYEYQEECTNGQTQPCSLTQGVCSNSYETCTNNQWPGCSSINYGVNYEVTELTCDDYLDNDCDNLIDDNDPDCQLECTNGQTQLCLLQYGVCLNSIETCTNNMWPGCSSSNYGVNYEVTELTCDDYLDNDCDNLIDINDPDCGPQTCEQQNGYVCQSTQYCSGTILPASNTNNCCSVECSESLLCSECGGLFGFGCSRTECYDILEGCYFLDVFIWPNDCNQCSSATCDSYSDDEQTCVDDPCGIGNCVWFGDLCIDSSTTPEICNDLIDNDGDNLIDCEDPECNGQMGPNALKCCSSPSHCTQDSCVIESCINNQCQYTNRDQCDPTECSLGSYCDSVGGNCVTPNTNSQSGENVCEICVSSQHNFGENWLFESLTTPYCCNIDANEYYITEGVGDAACCDNPSENCVDSSGLCRTEYPTETSCSDNLDNDCDGYSDEEDSDCGAVCISGDQRACPLTQGVCNGIVETCTNGQWPGCDYGINYELDVELTCDDDLDNDCYGDVDCDDSDCDDDPLCNLEQTCEEQNGFVCEENQYCAGELLTASNTNNCCSVECSDSLLCSECGGLFGFGCTRTECYGISEGCYFIDVVTFPNDCNVCAGATCDSYTEDQQTCTDDPCGLGCEWSENSCVTITSPPPGPGPGGSGGGGGGSGGGGSSSNQIPATPPVSEEIEEEFYQEESPLTLYTIDFTNENLLETTIKESSGYAINIDENEYILIVNEVNEDSVSLEIDSENIILTINSREKYNLLNNKELYITLLTTNNNEAEVKFEVKEIEIPAIQEVPKRTTVGELIAKNKIVIYSVLIFLILIAGFLYYFLKIKKQPTKPKYDENKIKTVIQDALKKGYSKKEVKDKFLKEGWPKKIINKFLN
ncbi:MAG: right-handed parallel beta-helix repeat-containing protein [Nanoarchaeota archaeon]|nr:right-handed parallel beta-helix repeat-containing protein [Nanoarchaeota archaeon]